MGDLTSLLELAESIAQRAAAVQLERLGSRIRVGTKSTATDMVTEVDGEVERLIVDSILAARPDDGILGEEGADVAGTSGHRWIVDPIDGTTNYLYGHPGFAVSIACERDGEVIAGVVNDPLHREQYAAVRGGGATRNGEPIRCSSETDPSKALVATGFGYDPERRRAQGEVLARIIGEIRDIRRMGAAAVDLCSVACGRVDAYFERGLNAWDLAAGELIASEAGAEITAIDGGPVRPGSVLAAAPALAGPLRELLDAAGAAAHD
jgi:myo-inositol-1(or 4)-monophosphatase